MKIILVLALSIFSLVAFAEDCDVKFKVEGINDEVSVNVCTIQDGDKSEHQAKYESCDCANKQVAKEDLNGNASTISHCDTDRVAVEYEYDADKKVYKKSGGTAQ